MGRRRIRSWSPSPLSGAVETVGGVKFAAAYCDVTEEGMVLALQRGYLTNARAVILLAKETLRRGRPVTIEALAGLNGDGSPLQPTGTDGPAEATKPAIGDATVSGGPAVDQAAAVLHLPVSTTAPRSPRTQKGARPRHSSSSRYGTTTDRELNDAAAYKRAA